MIPYDLSRLYIYTHVSEKKLLIKKLRIGFIINQREFHSVRGMLKKGFFKKLKKLGQKKNIVYIWKDLNSRYMSYIYGLRNKTRKINDD